MKLIFPASSGARPALPMGVAPEAMVGYLEAIIGSKYLFDLFQMFVLYAFSCTDVSCSPEDN
jgi:hypothetical protein